MIGSLLYLTINRLDIMYNVCLCAKFQACFKESHLNAVKRIFRYLKDTIDLGLWYPKSDNFELICYLDADFGGCKIDRKSINGTCHFLGHSLVFWHSRLHCQRWKPKIHSCRISRLGYAQVLWMKQTLSDLGLTFSHMFP